MNLCWNDDHGNSASYFGSPGEWLSWHHCGISQFLQVITGVISPVSRGPHRFTYISINQARSRSREKRLLPSSCPSVCLFGCPHVTSAVPTGRISVKFYIGDFLWKSVKKTETWLQSGKNIGHFTWRPKYVLLLPATLNHHKSLSSSDMVSGC